MMRLSLLSNIISDGKITFLNLLRSNEFAQENKLWAGIMDYRWLSKVLVISAILVSILLILAVGKWWNQVTNQMGLMNNFTQVIGSFLKGGYNLFVVGGLKYVVLILAEVVIFHFTRRTLELVTNEAVDNSFKAFLAAQKRMIKISIYAFFLESIYSIIFKMITSAMGIESINYIGIFIIHAFFVGFVIMDNYNEIYHLPKKQSFAIAKKYLGVTLVIGIPVYIIMLVPLVGTLIGPIMGAIAVTLTMHELINRDYADGLFQPQEA